jgi:6-phosphogluconolactonase
MTIQEYADQEMMAMAVANQLASELRQALALQDRVLFVVPGGSTPGPIFDDLCDVDLDWDRVDILLSDERWVPEVHLRSNTRLIRERLLVGRAAAARFLPLFAPADYPEAVLAELESNIVPSLPIAVALLGMGTDMHVASIFPTADRLEEALDRKAPILVPMRVPSEPDIRVTLSARVLCDAMRLHVVLTGRQKRAAVERARGLPVKQAPVRALLEADAVVHWSA